VFTSRRKRAAESGKALRLQGLYQAANWMPLQLWWCVARAQESNRNKGDGMDASKRVLDAAASIGIGQGTGGMQSNDGACEPSGLICGADEPVVISSGTLRAWANRIQPKPPPN
jgi:hypothetical protein